METKTNEMKMGMENKVENTAEENKSAVEKAKDAVKEAVGEKDNDICVDIEKAKEAAKEIISKVEVKEPVKATRALRGEKVMENKAVTTQETTVNTKREFVEFSYSSEDAFKRREAVKKAGESIKQVVKETGGNMPNELVDAYEGLNQVLEHIKKVELEVIRVGR